jgi:hypothetical protein
LVHPINQPSSERKTIVPEGRKLATPPLRVPTGVANHHPEKSRWVLVNEPFELVRKAPCLRIPQISVFAVFAISCG